MSFPAGFNMGNFMPCLKAPAAEAAPDGRGIREIFSNRAMHARRRFARRPSAGVYATRLEMSFVERDDVLALVEAS